MTPLTLTTWQRRRLERQLRETLDARVYRRTLAILEVAQGEPVASVAQRLRVTARAVYLWVEAYAQGHDPEALGDGDRSGRPSLVTDQDRALLLELLQRSPQDLDYAATEWTRIDPTAALSAIERTFGHAAIVLYGASTPFSNEAMVLGENTEAVTAAIGSNTNISFDETHLGIAESGSVIGLARRYRLMGLIFGLALCAAMAIWKHSSPFPPPLTVSPRERTIGRTSFSGLATLLARHVPPRELALACWQAWLKSNRNQLPPERVERAAAIARDPSLNPLEAVHEIQTTIRAKGTP